MRGDSIRDFYAKTLALLGLGVLAGTGALVDYWPSTPGVLPVARPVFTAPSFAWALPSASPELPAPATTMTAAAERPAPVLQSAETFTIPTAVASTELGQPVGLYEPEPVLLAAVSVQPLIFAAGTETSSLDAPLPEPFTTLASADLESGDSEPASFAAPAADEDRDGLIAGTSKRIGASIIKGSMKVGASFGGIAQDMAHFFGRSVRRVLPD
jgi:hypothetical protein